eukprot:335524-Chlamydomonas_euryale.AAC.1
MSGRSASAAQRQQGVLSRVDALPRGVHIDLKELQSGPDAFLQRILQHHDSVIRIMQAGQPGTRKGVQPNHRW